MLGKHQTLKEVGWQTLSTVVGENRFTQMVRDSRLIGMVNWTMLPRLGEIWQQMIDHVLPAITATATKTAASPRKLLFIDLADPEKRTANDLRSALAFCTSFQKFVDVVLGLNLKEAVQVAKVLGIETPADPEPTVESLSRSLRAKLNLHGVVIHPLAVLAAASCLESGEEVSAQFFGPSVAEPKILTGGGDHFNSGFCLGWLAGLSTAECLCAGTATSGFYVRNAASPSLDQLIDFITELPETAVG